MGHTVRIGVQFDGDYFTTYAADGLIVATPTGSTAYSFSARGPILDPGLRAMVLTPVSPHMLFDRSLVLAPDLEVRLEVLGHRPATLSLDGQNVGDLLPGDAVVCTASPTVARLVTFGPRDFHRILKTKFGLPDR
jgi:NAD+ kinase